MLGDEYISQHILQAYGDYAEQTSYRIYMSDMAKEIATYVANAEYTMRWQDILNELYESVTPEKQTETEEEIKSRLLSKLNGREGA